MRAGDVDWAAIGDVAVQRRWSMLRLCVFLYPHRLSLGYRAPGLLERHTTNDWTAMPFLLSSSNHLERTPQLHIPGLAIGNRSSHAGKPGVGGCEREEEEEAW